MLRLLCVSNIKLPLTVAHIYRPPNSNVVEFYEKLSDVLAIVMTSTTNRFLLCSDLNCPVNDSMSVSAELNNVFNTFDLNQHARDPTRTGYLRDLYHVLDLIVTNASLDVTGVIIIDTANHVSNHSHIVAMLAVSGDHAACPPTPHTSCQLKHIDVANCDHRLRASELMLHLIMMLQQL